jgi:2'-5' RNA ligase
LTGVESLKAPHLSFPSSAPSRNRTQKYLQTTCGQELLIECMKLDYLSGFKCKATWSQRSNIQVSLIHLNTAKGASSIMSNNNKNQQAVNTENRKINEIKVFQSSLCVIPPVSMWPTIQQLRRRHDKSYERWQPHINLLYPFIPRAQFDRNIAAIQQSLARVQPFTVYLNKFDYFKHGKSATLYLVPEFTPTEAKSNNSSEITPSSSPLQDLQQLVEQSFPMCNDTSNISEKGFIPHLSVGQCSSKDVELFCEHFNKTWKPLQFSVSAVNLISRNGFKDPFECRYTVKFNEDCLDSSEEEIVKKAAILAKEIPISVYEEELADG